MKLKSTLAIACVASFAIFAESCKSDETKKTVSGCKILSATETSDSGTEVESFTYATNGQIASLSIAINGNAPGTFSYVHNSAGKISGIHSSDGTLNSDLTYGANGKVSQTVTSNSDGTVYGKEVFTYNSSGQVTQQDSYGTQNDDPTLIRIIFYTFTYSNTTSTDPLTKTTFLDNNDGTSKQTITETYTYDDKNVPTGDPTTSSSHNTVKVVVSDANGVENTTTTVYEYNEEGYPTKATESSTGNSSTPATSNVTVATYSCQ